MAEARYSGLDVQLKGGTDRDGGGDGPLVILLHGFGANAQDLLPLWRILDVPRPTRFAFVDAPLVLPGYAGGRAWWMLNVARLEAATRGAPMPERDDEIPPGLDIARTQMLSLLEEIIADLRPPQLTLGGFSQGAMLACDVALHSSQPLHGLALLSGTLINAAAWRSLAPTRRGLRVLQSHGTADPLLPHAAAERLRDLLRSAGLQIEWLSFHGGHEIPDTVLERLGALIAAP